MSSRRSWVISVEKGEGSRVKLRIGCANQVAEGAPAQVAELLASLHCLYFDGAAGGSEKITPPVNRLNITIHVHSNVVEFANQIKLI